MLSSDDPSSHQIDKEIINGVVIGMFLSPLLIVIVFTMVICHEKQPTGFSCFCKPL